MWHSRGIARRFLWALAAPLVAAGMAAGFGPAAASAVACQNWTGVQPPSPRTVVNELDGVTVVSPSDVWAAGFDFGGGPDQTLILHWNGHKWSRVPSPSPGSLDGLAGVAATSAGNAWAVGDTLQNGTGEKPLILHWNGTTWKQVASPGPGDSGFLNGVGATSAANAWAVGTYDDGTADQTLTLRWNGTAWKQVASPNPAGPAHINVLWGVTATSASNAWAVGDYDNGSAQNTLILQWNGTTWAQVPSPSPGDSSNTLQGVAATSASNAWATGDAANSSGPDQALALRCT
jgi:hypothetical protein